MIVTYVGEKSKGDNFVMLTDLAQGCPRFEIGHQHTKIITIIMSSTPQGQQYFRSRLNFELICVVSLFQGQIIQKAKSDLTSLRYNKLF